MSAPDGERAVDLSDDDLEVLPDVTEDERAEGWGESVADNDIDRLLRDRPPHWD